MEDIIDFERLRIEILKDIRIIVSLNHICKVTDNWYSRTHDNFCLTDNLLFDWWLLLSWRAFVQYSSVVKWTIEQKPAYLDWCIKKILKSYFWINFYLYKFSVTKRKHVFWIKFKSWRITGPRKPRLTALYVYDVWHICDMCDIYMIHIKYVLAYIPTFVLKFLKHSISFYNRLSSQFFLLHSKFELCQHT